MKVSEAIEALKEYDGDLVLVFEDFEMGSLYEIDDFERVNCGVGSRYNDAQIDLASNEVEVVPSLLVIM